MICTMFQNKPVILVQDVQFPSEQVATCLHNVLSPATFTTYVNTFNFLSPIIFITHVFTH